MKVNKTSKGVILTVSDLDELLDLNGVKYYQNPRTKLSSEIYEIKVDGQLEIDEDERDYINSLSDTTIPFTPETYDLTLYGKVVGNLGLNVYDMPYGYGRNTLVKVNLKYPEAEKIDSRVWPICGTMFITLPDVPSQTVEFSIDEELNVFTDGRDMLGSETFHAFEKEDSNEIGIAWSPVSGWGPSDEVFKIVFHNKEKTEYDFEITNNTLHWRTLSKRSNGSEKEVLWNSRKQFASFECPNLDEVPKEGFVAAPNLTKFSSENVKHIGKSAFQQSDLQKIYAPNVETIDELAFAYTMISEVDFPKVKMLHVSREDKTPFLNCTISSFCMDGLQYCVNDEDKWFWEMEQIQRNSWMRQHGYIYSPGALATSYKEIEYLKGFNPLYGTRGLKKLSLKSYNCGTPNPNDFDYDVEYVYYPISRDLISGDYLSDVEELNIQSMEKIPSHFAEKLSNVRNVNFNKDLKCVFDSGFEGSELLSGVLSFEKLEYIGKKAFANCKNITKVVLPANIETIDSEAFASCDNLEKIEGASRVSFFGRKSSTENAVATNIFAGTKVKDVYYDYLSYNPIQYKEDAASDDPPAVDIFGKDITLHVKAREEYQPLPNEVPGIVIHPFIRQMSPFVSYMLNKSEELNREVNVSVPADIYADYLLKCQNNPFNPGFDPSFSETMATIQTANRIIQKIDAGETISDSERNIVVHKEELEMFSNSMEYARTHLEKFVPSTPEGISVFDLSSLTSPTVISFGKNKISQFETNKKEFFSFVPSFVESWELDPPTAPEIEISRIYDTDFQNNTTNFDFKVLDAGRKSGNVQLSAIITDMETGKIVWQKLVVDGAIVGETYSVNAPGHNSGNQYSIKLIGKNNNGLIDEKEKHYRATAFNKGSISFVKAISVNSTTIKVEFELSKLPTDANGNPFNPTVDIFVKSTDGKASAKASLANATISEYTKEFKGLANDKTYEITIVENGKSDDYDVSYSIKFKHRITRKLVFASGDHYKGKQWQFKQKNGSVTKEVVVGVPYYFNYSDYGYTTNSYTTIYGWTKTKNSYKAAFKNGAAITLTDSDPASITFYPVPGRITINYNSNLSQELYLRTRTRNDSTATTHGNFGLPDINTGLPEARMWYAFEMRINNKGQRSAENSSWFEFRDNNVPSGNNSWKTIMSTHLGSVTNKNVAVKTNSGGRIRLWCAGRLYATRRNPVDSDVRMEFRIPHGFYTYINK